MLRPKLDEATKMYTESQGYDRIRKMQAACLQGKVSEAEYNAALDSEISMHPEVKPGCFMLYVKDGVMVESLSN